MKPKCFFFSSKNQLWHICFVIFRSAATHTTPVQRTQPNTNGIRLVPASQLRQVSKPGGTAPAQYTLTNSGGGNSTPTFTPTPQARPQQITTHQIIRIQKHPAPLPDPPRHQISNPSMKGAPPRPTLKISRLTSGELFFCVIIPWNRIVNVLLCVVLTKFILKQFTKIVIEKHQMISLNNRYSETNSLKLYEFLKFQGFNFYSNEKC